MDEIERLNQYIDFYQSCLDRLLGMYPDAGAKEMYELGVKDGADLAWMHGSDATAQELEKAYFQGMDEAMKMRNVQPVVHGRWINQKADSEKCSICGTKFYISSLFLVGGNDEPNFCPNCGARMDK